MRLIDADALIDIYNRNSITDLIVVGDKTVKQHVYDAPTIDAVPVVHGQFVRYPEVTFPDVRITPILCVTCGTTFATLNKNSKKAICCPYCGARMDGESQ